MKERIDWAIEEWKELVRLANEVKNVEIDNMIEDDEGIHSEKIMVEGIELLRKSMDEYKKESIIKYKNKEIDINEDMEEILKGIKQEIDNRYI